jgi:hypothetical protein
VAWLCLAGLDAIAPSPSHAVLCRAVQAKQEQEGSAGSQEQQQEGEQKVEQKDKELVNASA